MNLLQSWDRYFCYLWAMLRNLLLILIISGVSTVFVRSQTIIKTSDLFKKTDANSQSGQLNVYQDPALDTLISRYIYSYKNLEEKNGYAGMEGWRIQIFNSSSRNAKVDAGNILQEFLNKFPEIKYPELKYYTQFALPNYYKVRVGNFRTKTEATKLYLLISKAFPDAYIVPDIINFPDTK
jgi:hypothetical protein